MDSFLRNYGPVLLIVLWFGYRWFKTHRIKRMLPELKRRGAFILDVRSQGEFAAGNAPGSVNIPLQELGRRMNEIPAMSDVIVCCASGTRSAMASGILKRNGHHVYNIGSWANLL